MGGAPSRDAAQAVMLTASYKGRGMVEDNTAILTHQDMHVDQNFAISERKIKLSRQKGLTLQIEGAGVFQIGLTRQDPGDSRKRPESPDFVIEDGSQEGTSAREIYVDAGYLYYGSKGEATEVKEWEGDVGEAWLFIVVLYGKPKFRLFKGQEEPEPWRLRCGANLSITKDTVTSSGKTSDSVLCVTEHLRPNETYRIEWDMRLDHEESRSADFGFFRLGLTTKKLDVPMLRARSLFNDATDESEDTWFLSSAVQKYPYSGVMSFRVSSVLGEVTHNVLVESVNNTTTFTLPPNFRGPLYLVVELFFGQLTIYRLRNCPVKQGLGSILYIEDYGEDDETVDDLMANLTNNVGHKPVRIQYGYSPRNFACEFARQLSVRDVAAARQNLQGSVVNAINETATVQLLNVSSDVSENDLKLVFENQRASGGGELIHIEQDEDVKSCWLLTFKEMDAARRVWRVNSHCINHCQMKALPFYPELGVATNAGNQPVFDDSPLMMENFDQIDRLKLRYIKNKSRTHFQDFLSSLVSVEFLPEDNCEEEVEEDEDEEDVGHVTGLKLDCSESCKRDDRRRAIWKEQSKIRVKDYLTKVHVERLQVTCTENQVLGVLKKFKTFDILFDREHEQKEIALVSQKHDVIKEASTALQQQSRKGSSFRRECDAAIAFPYNVLDFEDKLQSIQTSNRNTSFGLEEGIVVIEGPEEEVNRAFAAIVELTMNVQQKDLSVSPEKMQFFRTKGGFQHFQSLVHNKMKMYFELGDNQITFGAYKATNSDLNKMSKNLHSCLETIVTCVVKLEEDTYLLKDTEVERKFLQSLRSRSNLVVERREDSIALIGTKYRIQNEKSAIDDFYKKHGQRRVQVRISGAVAKFLHDHVKLGLLPKEQADVVFEEDDGLVTGLISISGSGDLQSLRESILKHAGTVGLYWMKIEKSWLATMALEINLSVLESNNECSLHVETGSSLAENGIASVALSSNGALIQVIHGDVTELDVDCIINATDDRLSLNSKIAAAIAEKGGRDRLTPDCQLYIEKHGVMAVGNVMRCTSGRLPCRSVIHGSCPTWQDGGQDEVSQMTSLVTNALQLAAKDGHVSVVIPALGTDEFGFPVKAAAKAIAEAVRAFLSGHTNLRTVREVYLCGTMEHVDAFSDALDAIGSQTWFVFRHGIALPLASQQHQNTPTKAATASLTEETVHLNDKNMSMRWGTRPKTPRGRRAPVTPAESSNINLPYSCAMSKTTKLSIKLGRLEEQEADCIVSFTPQFPALHGEIPAALLKRGGGRIQDECDQIGDLEYGRVVATSPGSLRCKRLYHVRNHANWDSPRGKQAVYQMVFDCLSKAMSDGFTSIAFPAVGTGKANYPADDVAAAMLAAVENFLKEDAGFCLREVVFVLFPTDTEIHTAFQNYVENMTQSASNVEGPKNVKAVKARSQRVTNVNASSPSQRCNTDDTLLVMVVTDQPKEKGRLENALLAEIGTLYKTHTIKIDQLEMKFVTPDEQRIQQVASKHRVELTLDQNASEIRITGPRREVQNATYVLNDLIFRIIQSEHDLQADRDLIGRVVEWQMIIDGNTEKLPNEAVLSVEKAFHDASNCQFEHNSRCYEANFQTMKANPVADNSKKYDIRRIWLQATGVSLPTTWHIASTGQECSIVPLDSGSDEFNEVKKEFVSGFRKYPNTPQQTAISKYATKKEELENRNRGHQNERNLWHGTGVDSVELINKHGFNKAFSGTHAAVHGDGVYFALESGYSGRDTYARKDNNNVRRMYRAKVLVGHVTKGAQNMKVLPARQGAIKYDSAVDDLGNPQMFIIFNDTQTYPEYLIEYKTD